jgi:hypothetical protein
MKGSVVQQSGGAAGLLCMLVLCCQVLSMFTAVLSTWTARQVQQHTPECCMSVCLHGAPSCSKLARQDLVKAACEVYLSFVHSEAQFNIYARFKRYRSKAWQVTCTMSQVCMAKPLA